MEGIGALHSFLPDVQNALCEAFASAECSMERTPNLTDPPFSFAFQSLGSKIYLLPSSSTPPKDYHQLASLPEGEIVTDGTPVDTIHLLLEGGDDWRSPIQKYFNKAIGSEWCFVAMELSGDVPTFSIFSPQTKVVKSPTTNNSVWLAPVSTAPVYVETAPKPKVIKKVLVKKSDKTSGTTTATTTGTAKVAKSSSGTKIVRKKVVSKDGSSAATNGDAKEKLTNGVKKTSPEKITKPNDELSKSEGANGEGSGIDSGISVADSDNEKSQKTEAASPSENDVSHSMFIEHLDITPNIALDSLQANEDPEPMREENGKLHTESLEAKGKEDDDFSTSFTMKLTMPTLPEATKRESRKMERILEEEEKPKYEDSVINGDAYGATREFGATVYGMAPKKDVNEEEEERSSREQSSTSSRLSPPSEVSERDIRIHAKGSKERRSSPALTHVREVVLRARGEELPVFVLQQVLKKFSYKELGELRLVHPHWDELCGQALNQAYYDIVKRANELLMECQRRVPQERDLHDALSVLTNLQVHILNPVDVLRPAMDEGVCCFPYGELLDRICAILSRVEQMMKGDYDLFVNWKPVSELARQAQMHYKLNMENVMEEKLGDVFRLKALAQIQRIDSFMIDSTVNKLEKAAHMARDDLEWEIEQLRQQNVQLRKDNRELKKEYMRLESRVEVLEGKFKTMARLLQ